MSKSKVVASADPKSTLSSADSKAAKGDGGEASWEHIDFREIDLGERISGGGVGVIYSGQFRGETVALKTLFDTRVSEELKQEYMDELLVMSKVKHSNIVKFMGACMTPPHLFFVMEMCAGSLFDILHNERVPLSEKECVRMAIDVASAMEYLHAQRPSIVHRDLKSHNVLRAYDGSLKVCDFGLVKAKNAQAGTPAYMAPELFENKPFNKSVDVFAFAVLLWELFTGEVPYYMVEISDIRRRVSSGDRPRIPTTGCPAGCGQLIRQGWSQRPDERPDFTTIVDRLLEIDDETPESKFTDTVGSADALDSLLFK